MLFEWDEAEIARVEGSDRHWVLTLSAAAVLQPAAAGQVAERMWMPVTVTMALAAPAPADWGGAWVGRLRQGVLRQAGQRHRQWPVPSVVEGPWVLELEHAHGHWVALQGERLALALPAHACAVGAYQC